ELPDAARELCRRQVDLARAHEPTFGWTLMSQPSVGCSRCEVESEARRKPFEVALVEQLRVDLGIAGPQLPQLPVLAGDERLLHHGDFEVEVLIGQVEVGREGLGDAAGR